ncbi:MAG: asparagine synthase (glutamine-hydrolyzing) [Bacteroidales bacterium]|nr:asparagine synthase (glutamine-hydrolyzing) [Bacteroidales bacterium]HOY39824.1 asparagine synthase (glutamine-hydrolyzing) [Bacteroidales bacterium]HQP04858.1 asparagine synthase (glutamine-hydrolyzing) [Bacteroidales bacterium]
MCGITGIYAFNKSGTDKFRFVDAAVKTLSKRGPDGYGTYQGNNVRLGHTRLSIIDTSDAGSQPFTDPTGRYTLIYNGEFYNYKEFRHQYEKEGIHFRSTSDTEVLLYLLIKEGKEGLKKLNGCFSIAFYDNDKEELLLARDRMGINPLLYYLDKNVLIFGSEMKSILAYNIEKNIDSSSLYAYFQLNYIPGEKSIFQNVFRLTPGAYLEVSKNSVNKERFYQIPNSGKLDISLNEAESHLISLLDASVQRRLVADVPLGSFLSGGIDSSIIVALASRHTSHLNTFSIGYSDEPFFDETNYAELVAKKFNTNHTVFKLSNDDLLHQLPEVLDYLDEPFADSSAIAVHVLSMHTRKTATVALSGDGADEMFAGYNKHLAHFKLIHPSAKEHLALYFSWLWSNLPQSRNTKYSNLFRQLDKFCQGAKLTAKERYWNWAGITQENQIHFLLKDTFLNKTGGKARKEEMLQYFEGKSEMREILYTDMHMVLQNDMLTKVDLMSMANSLEVRVPFLDHTVVDFAFQLPDAYKINLSHKKIILQEAFRSMLPAELYHRPKHGFEVPLLKWFRNELWSMIDNDLLSERFVTEQNVFKYEAIEKLKDKLTSNNPGDSQAQIWALLVFQNWWKKYYV